MKKNYFLLFTAFFMVATSILIFSCGRHGEQAGAADPNPFSYVGKMHNEGLDYVFQYLKANKAQIVSSRSGDLKRDFAEAYPAAVKLFLEEKGIESVSGFTPRTLSPVTRSIGEEIGLSSRGSYYYDCLMDALYDENTNEQQKVALVQALDAQIINDPQLDELNATALLCGTATAVASFAYWRENLESWEEELNTPAFGLDTRSTIRLNITGKVTNGAGESLSGVNVIEKGTTNGVTTDLWGAYRITVNMGATLIFSYLGFKEQWVPVSRSPINVTMKDADEEDFWDGIWGKTIKVVGLDAVGAIAGVLTGGVGGAIKDGVLLSAGAMIDI